MVDSATGSARRRTRSSARSSPIATDAGDAMRKIALSSIVVAFGLGAALPAWSVLHDMIKLGSAPPPPRLEDHPQDREGSVWIPGYWDYRNSDYTWVEGRFEPARKGYVYVPPRYEQSN